MYVYIYKYIYTIINIVKVLLCFTDTALYIYVCVKHFGVANIKYSCNARTISFSKM